MRSIRAALVFFLALSASASAAPPRATSAGRGGWARIAGLARPVPRSPRSAWEDKDGWGASYRQKLGPVTNPRGTVHRVFYPLGGPDVETAFAAFTSPAGSPTEVAIADALPFGGPAELAAAHQEVARKDHFFGPFASGSYTLMDNFPLDVRLAGAAVLWKLEKMGARRVRVRYLDEHGHDRIPPAKARDVNRGGGLSTTNLPYYDLHDRDIVAVDFVWEGRPRRLLYVQQNILKPETYPPVLQRFLAGGIDAMVHKAALWVEGNPDYQRATASFLKQLRPGGVVVTDSDSHAGNLRREAEMTEERVPVRFGYALEDIHPTYSMRYHYHRDEQGRQQQTAEKVPELRGGAIVLRRP